MTMSTVAAILSLLAASCLLPRLGRFLGGDGARRAAGIFWSACALAFVIAMITHPGLAFEGATTGLKVWWNIVFPSLLPFFIASEILISFGLVGFMGVLLEPVMRPLFNVPGCGSFVLCVGYTSGYPVAAMVTARLRSQGLCTRVEAERLMCFTSNSSPLFMIVAVSAGMFGRPELAVVIAASHYLANLALGIVMRFYGGRDREQLPLRGRPYGSLPARAFGELSRAWRQETRHPGKIAGDAVRNAVGNLLNIGGFIILFAVIIRILSETGLIDGLAGLLGTLLLPLGFAPEIMPALAAGFFEITIGAKLASESSAPIIQKVAAVGMILAWSGLSVLAQVAGMISETDIRMFPFVCARVAHAALAAAFTFILLGPAAPLACDLAVPAATTLEKFNHTPSFLVSLQFSGAILLLALASLTVLSIICINVKKIKIIL